MALLFMSSAWDNDTWLNRTRAIDGNIDLRGWPDMGNVDDIRYAMVWKPPAGELAKLPNLQVIFSLGAGVDHIFQDPDLPDCPVVRTVDENLTMRMSEYVVLHVLMHHRQVRRYDTQQAAKVWQGHIQAGADEVRIGVLGMGVLGSDAARKLAVLGFKVAGWSNTRKSVDGVESFAGQSELKAFLNRTDILVSLLPLTPDTKGFINRDLLRELARDGEGAGPVLINTGRGGVQVEADILAALEADELQAATLDVFETEPLPEASALWSHPRVTVTPHNSADSDPRALCGSVLEQIHRFEAGKPLENQVDRARYY